MKVPVEEALRYLRAGADPETRRMAEETAAAMESRLTPRFLWRACRIERGGGSISLPEAALTLPGTLAEMQRAWSARDMARAAVLDACGSAWTEAACDAAEEEIRSRFPGMYLTDRFSPGYGDLPLSLQADFLRATDAGRKLGITANESFLMLPSKSVTAVIGLADRPQGAKIRGCAYCGMRENCEYRRGGKFCGV